jgi:hypothetical protein
MDRTQLKSIFGRILGEFVQPYLESRGFRARANGQFRKTEGDNEFLVGLQLLRPPSQSVEGGAIVAFQRVWQFIRQFDGFDRTEIFSATGCGGRLQLLFPREVEPRWSWIDESTSAEDLGAELVGQLDQYVFPYLDHYRKLGNAMEFWARDREYGCLARVAAILLLGERDNAFAEMDDLIRARVEEHETAKAENYKPVSAAQRLEACSRFKEFLEHADVSRFRYGPHELNG